MESFGAFLKAMFQKWWLLVTGVVGGGVFILNLFGMNPSVSRTLGGGLLIVCVVVASFMAYRDLWVESRKGKKEKEEPSGILAPPLHGHLRSYHSTTLWSVSNHMYAVHGHSDEDGLESDFRRGVLADELMKRNCTRCGKPRNQRGGIE